MNVGMSAFLLVAGACLGQHVPEATGIQAVYRNGQTFITWKDAAEGEAGAKYRYRLYRAEQPITQANLESAELCAQGILHNSARLYGTAFNFKDRALAAKPYSILDEGGSPLPPWSGLAVHTVRKPARACYAVLVTDEKRNPLSKIMPGRSATTAAVDEKPASIQPIKLHDSKQRTGPYIASTSITGKKGLPLHITLHGSQSGGGGAGDYGDYYLYFGTPDMGFSDGLAGVFSVEEHRSKEGNRLLLRVRDAVEHPSGKRAMETYWFGYVCVPQWASHTDPRFYPFTEARLLWTVDWVVQHYAVDAQRVTMGGSSSGAVGSMNVGFRHPERFAAVYPSVGRVRRVPAVGLDAPLKKGQSVLMSDGVTDYYDRADGPRFAAEHHEDLPFLGWACGRRDGYATWQEHIDMVKVMTASKHGFAFSWNNGDHSGGGAAMQAINKYYPAHKFDRKRSYPAFGNSSLDDRMGNGDPAEGDLEGGINLGFDWNDVVDTKEKWSVKLFNALTKKDMTVDVTPRRCQHFAPQPGDRLQWQTSTATGTIEADPHGLATAPQVKLRLGEWTTLTITAK